MIQLELQMDMLWVLFGSTIKVRPMSISEQNATSRNQVTGLAATLLSSICTFAVFSRTFCWCCQESSPTHSEGQTKKYHWVPRISAAMQACILQDFFQYKPHHSLNTAKLTLVITDSPRCLLTGNRIGKKKMQTTFPRLDPAHENKSYWPSPWCRVSSFWYLCLFPTLLFQFEFLILSICGFSFSFST